MTQAESDLDAFLEECQDQILVDARATLPKLLKAPDIIDASRDNLGDSYAAYRVRGFGVLASGLLIFGSTVMAARVFLKARNQDCDDPGELAALGCREAIFILIQGDHSRARRLAVESRTVLEKDDPTHARDDRSLAFALMIEAVIEGRSYVEGKSASLERCARLYQQALQALLPQMRRTREAIIIGIGAAASQFWFARKTSVYANPRPIAQQLVTLRKQMRRESVPTRSLVDARARWVLGLATWKLSGEQLAPSSESLLFSSRDDFSCLGRYSDVAEISLDIQWCLVNEGRWGRARSEWKMVEALTEHLPQQWQIAVILWKEALDREAIDATLIQRCFSGLRGLQGVVVPGSSTRATRVINAGW